MERYFLAQYNDNDFSIYCIKYMVKDEKETKKKYINNKTDKEEINRISLSRTKRKIKEYALCNDFQYFVTLTINSQLCDRFSLDLAQEKLKKILHCMRTKAIQKGLDFKYILITEKHKDGAFHFHGLMKNVLNLYENENGYLSCTDFDTKLGFCSFSKIKDYSKCCNYITKYITKDCIKNSKNTIFLASKGLKKPYISRIEPVDFSYFASSKPVFENDFIVKKDFSLSENNKQELLYLTMIKNTKSFRLTEGIKKFLSNNIDRIV